MARPIFPQLDRLSDYSDSEAFRPRRMPGASRVRPPPQDRASRASVDHLLREDGRTPKQGGADDAE